LEDISYLQIGDNFGNSIFMKKLYTSPEIKNCGTKVFERENPDYLLIRN